MIETRRLKNIVIFIQTILNFVLSRKITVKSIAFFTVTVLSKKYKCMFYQGYWKRFCQKTRISLLKWEGLYHTPINKYSIKNSIQWGVGLLSTTNHSRVMEDILESFVLFFEKNKYTNIRRFWTIFFLKARFIASKKFRKKYFQ